MYTLSNSRQNFDLKYQMPKHNMQADLLFCTKAFLFGCENNRCGQRTRKASPSSTNHSFPGMICLVSENHRRDLFRAVKTKNAAPFSGRFLSFTHWNWRMLRHIYVADRFTLNNRNSNRTKEIGVRMWRTAYPNSATFLYFGLMSDIRSL